MNIFVLDRDPNKAAEMMCDKHVVKMIIESCQMLSAVFEDDYCGHPKSVFKHPCTLWLKESTGNILWLLTHHQAMLKEYTRRYGKTHKFNDSVEHFLTLLNTKPVYVQQMTEFANATPYKDVDVVKAYRQYYLTDKAHFAKWKLGNIPEWFSNAA